MDGFLLVFGWTRTTNARRLVAWVTADALVMAALMFIGTPARTVVAHVAVDGALFAAAFISTSLALGQVAVVYSGVVMATIARDQGSTLPTAPQGWQTPIVVTLAGILALRFLRSALGRLAIALAGRAHALAEQRRLLRAAATEEAMARDIAAIQGEVVPALGRLEAMCQRYALLAPGGPGRQESGWLADCCRLARSDLAELQRVLDPPEATSLAEIVDTAILGASAPRLTQGMSTATCSPTWRS